MSITETQRHLHYHAKPLFMQRILALKGDRKKQKVKAASRVDLHEAIAQRKAYEESVTAAWHLRPDWMSEHNGCDRLIIMIEEPTHAVLLQCPQHLDDRERIPGDVVEKYVLAQIRGR